MYLYFDIEQFCKMKIVSFLLITKDKLKPFS